MLSFRIIKILAGAIVLSSACASPEPDEEAPETPPQAPPQLNVTLFPRVAKGEVSAVDISLEIESPDATPDAPFLRLPMVFAATPSARYEAGDIDATDTEGSVPLTQTDDPADPNNSIYFRRYFVSRPTVGDVVVRYRYPGEMFGPRTTVGPPFNLMRQDGGFSGAGVTFFAAPDTQHPYRIRLDWDLSEMAPGARGVWSMGEGAVETVGPVDVLVNAYYMAGPALSSFPPEGGGVFGIYWMGEPQFDIDAIGGWIVEAYAAMSSFFNTPDRPFRVFLRENPDTEYGGGGAGLVNSFMAGYGEHEEVSVSSMRDLLAHEMAHNWPGSLSGPVGEASWYGEGMAEHYDPHLTFRAGLLTPEDFIADANRRAKGYYTNELNDLPAPEIAGLFWRDGRARRLPYTRGSLYLAGVDAQMRARYEGERSLDDLTLAMIARREDGKSHDRAAWVELISAELGETAVAEFEAMMAGELLSPPSDAYGPCFHRVETTYRGFDLGFEPRILSMAPPKIISGLDADSNAARAGLRNGDEVLNVVPVDSLMEDEGAIAVLHVRRDGEETEIRYDPHSAPVGGYKWERKPDVPDSACNVWGVLPRQ